MTVLRGYAPVAGATCPYCGGNVFAFEDDGDLFIAVLCWCGARGRVPRDDPDLVAHLEQG